MSRILKDLCQNLLQRDPFREAGGIRIRKVAPRPTGPREHGDTLRAHAGFRQALLLTLLALPVAFWLADGQEALLVRLGYQSVAPLPEPPATLDLDDQARYWTLALYDFDALERRFQVSGYFAIDAALAQRRLDALLPHVSASVLGEISAYTTIAYHGLPRTRLRP